MPARLHAHPDIAILKDGFRNPSKKQHSLIMHKKLQITIYFILFFFFFLFYF